MTQIKRSKGYNKINKISFFSDVQYFVFLRNIQDSNHSQHRVPHVLPTSQVSWHVNYKGVYGGPEVYN